MPSHPDESAALAIQTPAINDRSLAAGLAYAMGSRVSGISFDAATGLMLGKVRGGSDVPYSTTAKLVRKAGGWSCTVGVCSCPVRKDCKHVAALLFAAEDNPATRVQLLAPADTSRLSRQAPVLEVPDWEQALSPLIARPGITPSTNGIPLALQFEIEEPTPHFSYTGRRDPLRSVRQLKARPVIMGAKGKWIRGDVSWNTLSYLSYRRECNEAHVEWMQEFLASHTALASRQHSGSAPWLGLNTYAGKNLWSLLAQARKIGVALVHGSGQEPVRVVETPAAVGLNLTRFGEGPNPGLKGCRWRRRGHGRRHGSRRRAVAGAHHHGRGCRDRPGPRRHDRTAGARDFPDLGRRRPARRCAVGLHHQPCPAGSRAQRGTADLRDRREHPAHPGP
ncbi:hypothetical protein QFZ69_000112 [Arthrobacter sp. V1I7]|nr:hypothetical protein [Arthrobacter sp. V1I7]